MSDLLQDVQTKSPDAYPPLPGSLRNLLPSSFKFLQPFILNFDQWDWFQILLVRIRSMFGQQTVPERASKLIDIWEKYLAENRSTVSQPATNQSIELNSFYEDLTQSEPGLS